LQPAAPRTSRVESERAATRENVLRWVVFMGLRNSGPPGEMMLGWPQGSQMQRLRLRVFRGRDEQTKPTVEDGLRLRICGTYFFPVSWDAGAGGGEGEGAGLYAGAG
jgi:hypothetical protein